MNFYRQSFNHLSLTLIADHLLIVYGTSDLADSLPVHQLLVPEEIVHAEKLRGEGQKKTWLSSRAALRLILATYQGKNANEIEFRKGRFGKIYLANSTIWFNVSHSRHSFLLGFNRGGRIGVDIEVLDGSEDLPSLIKYAFSEIEISYFHNGDGTERFTEIWTLKEALLKAAGIGLVDPLSSITVVGESSNCITRYRLNQKTFSCPNGETGSIVYRGEAPVMPIWLL